MAIDMKHFGKTGVRPAPVVDYLRLSVTDRCNFRCSYCMPPEGVALKEHGDILTFEEIVRFARAAVDAGITRVRVTGGEPLVRRGCPELIERLAAIPGIRDLALTTNGSLLGRFAGDLQEAGLKRVNISIDSLDPQRFAEITGGAGLAPVWTGLMRVLELGFNPVKVNAVMLSGIEDDLERFVALAAELPVHVRFIEQMPIGSPPGRGPWRFVSRARLQARLEGFGKLLPAGPPVGAGPARYFRFAGAAGTIGFISSMSSHFCGDCNRLRLTADGKLKNCLFSDEEVDVREQIGGEPAELAGAIRGSMNSKKFARQNTGSGSRAMSQIGG
jgi:cyclic pyranopterin phosphate synthase